jgi:hypothetical protein
MGTQRQIPLVLTSAEGGISGEEALINVFPVRTDGGKYEYTLQHTPGLAMYVELPTYPVLGMHEIDSRAFVVTPTKFYEIFDEGTFRELGDVDLSGRASLADNGLQVVVVDGFKGFYLDLSDDSVNEITAEGFYPSKFVTFQDGYFLFERKGTNQFYSSEALDITFDPADYANAEGSPDNVVRVISDHRELFVFGESTIEVWYNSGASGIPFDRNNGVFIEKGCAAPHSIAKQDNTLFFVGSDLIVYRLAGYAPIRISNNAVEDDLQDVDLSDAFAYAYHYDGTLFYTLTIPSRNVTWRLDLSNGSWHKLDSYQFGRHYSNCHMYFSKRNLVGDFQNGRIYQISNKIYTDDGDVIQRKFILPTINIGRNFLPIASFELDMSSGVGTSIGQGSDPKAMMRFSKDSGKTWSNYKFANIGKIGEYLTRVKWNRLGVARQFTVEITISDPIPIDIGGAYVEI